jgi:restriction endonuclease S subunit
MITYSIIQKSQLEGALRLDAEYYQPEYLNLISNLKSQKSKFLGEIGKVAYGTTPQGGIFEKSGIPFIRSQNFSNLLIDTSDLVFCTKEFHQQNKKSAIQPGDILFAAVGATIGEIAIVQDEIEEGNINQNIARVRITDKSINPYFVGFFFASRPGQLQIERLITGNAQPYLNSEQIKSLIIPILPVEQQREIADYFQKIQKQIKISQDLYSQAEDLLLEELGLKDFKVEDDLFYVVNLSKTKSAHRADAEYFQPKYEKLIKCMERNVEIRELKEIATTKRGSLIDPRFYNETEGIPYIRGKDFSSGRLEKSSLVYISRDFRPKNETRVNVGDLVFALIGTVGTSALVTEEFDNSFISNNVGKISIKNKKQIIPEYLAIVLNSIVGKLQFEKEASQTAQPKISDFQVRNFKIPILPKPTQQKIADLVQKSHEARKKAKQLLDKAKRKFEKLIEEN